MKISVLTALVAVTLLGSSAAFAQGPDGPPPFGGGPDGPPPFGGGPGGPPPFQGGPGGFGGPQRELTAVQVPVDALAYYLKLTPQQTKKITALVDQVRVQRYYPIVLPPEGTNDPNPAPEQERPSFEEHEAKRKRFEAAEARAVQSISQVLTAEQRHKLPELIKALSALRADRISLSAAASLKLTSSQVKRLAAVGKSAIHEDVVNDFTADQTEIADLNRQERRGRPGGGPPGGGRMAGFRGGRPGGPPPFGGPDGEMPPPPPDGPDGPPPQGGPF